MSQSSATLGRLREGVRLGLAASSRPSLLSGTDPLLLPTAAVVGARDVTTLDPFLFAEAAAVLLAWLSFCTSISSQRTQAEIPCISATLFLGETCDLGCVGCAVCCASRELAERKNLRSCHLDGRNKKAFVIVGNPLQFVTTLFFTFFLNNLYINISTIQIVLLINKYYS